MTLSKAGRGGGERVYLSVGQQEGPVMIDPMRRYADALRDGAKGDGNLLALSRVRGFAWAR